MAQILGVDGQLPPKPQTPVIDITKTEPIACKKCGSEIFISGLVVRKLSKLLTGQKKDEILPFEVYLCGDCGELLDESLPEGLKLD
jgi:DNA-directed RNA polymerase subunit RPC12/RpoP